MLRLQMVCAIALVLVNGLAVAENYKCENDQGIIIYTDDPTKVPGKCNAEQAIELPQPNVMQVPTNRPAGQGAKAPAAAPAKGPSQQESEDRSYPVFKQEAAALVMKYDAARQKATFQPLFRDKQAARKAVRDIKQQKLSLLAEVENSSLQQAEKNEIIERLSSIPD